VGTNIEMKQSVRNILASVSKNTEKYNWYSKLHNKLALLKNAVLQLSMTDALCSLR